MFALMGEYGDVEVCVGVFECVVAAARMSERCYEGIECGESIYCQITSDNHAWGWHIVDAAGVTLASYDEMLSAVLHACQPSGYLGYLVRGVLPRVMDQFPDSDIPF